MREVQIIREHLESQPADWAARQMLADLYEDMGDADRARFQRWLVRWKRHADRDVWMSNSHPPHHLYWWTNGSYGGTAHPSHVGSTLAFTRLPSYVHGGYNSHQEAEEDLLYSLQRHNWCNPE